MQDEPKARAGVCRPRRAGVCKPISIRQAGAAWDLFEAAADCFGVDVSTVINLLLAESLPLLAAKVRQHEADLADLSESLDRKESA